MGATVFTMGKGKACCASEEEDQQEASKKMRESSEGGENAITALSRCQTDPHMLLVFIAFLVGMAIILVTAINEGEIERILYGLDYTGKSCGTGDASDYKHQFWPNVLYYKELGSVCLDDCPASPDLFDWPTSGTLSVVCHCAAKVAVGNELTTGSSENYNVQESLNANNATSTLGVLCNTAPWKDLGYYKGSVDVSPSSNNWYKYLAPATTNPTGNSEYSDSYKLNIPLCNPVYRTKKVMNRCIPWIEPSVMLKMFCGASAENCPTDTLSEEFEGVAAFFEEAIADIATAWYVIAASGGIALVIGFMYLFFMEKCATCVVAMGLIGTILGTAAMTFAFYIEYDNLKDRVDTTPQLATHEEDERNMYICMAFAIIFAIACAIVLCVVICFCKQVCVAAKLLECAADAIMDMPMLIFYPLGNIFNLLCFFAMFVAGSLFIASAGTIKYESIYGYAEVEFDDTLQGAFVYWLFGFLWICEFASAVGFMVVAFCFSMWFYAPKAGGSERENERVMVGWPICTAIRLTMCHHLGTCAAGSLIIAIIQMLRIILEYLDNKKKEVEEAGVVPCMCLWDFVFCCCRCCLWCMEKCMKYINKVAYIFTVIKGEWFCSAACSAVTMLITDFSWVAIVSGITSCILFFGKLMTSLIVAAICGYWTSTLDVSSILFPTIFTFIIAYAIAMLFAEVYEMAIDTMLICYLYAKTKGWLDAGGSAEGCVPPEFQAACDEHESQDKDKKAQSAKNKEANAKQMAAPTEGGDTKYGDSV